MSLSHRAPDRRMTTLKVCLFLPLITHLFILNTSQLSKYLHFLSADMASSSRLMVLTHITLIVFLAQPLTENGYPSDQQSLRLQRVSSRVSNQNYPQHDWSSTPAEEDDGGSSGPPRDLKAIPLPMSLKRAVRYESTLHVFCFKFPSKHGYNINHYTLKYN